MSVNYNQISDIKVLPIHTFQFNRASDGTDFTFKYLQSGSNIQLDTIKSSRKDENGRNRIVAISFDVNLILLNTNYQDMLTDGTIKALVNQDIGGWDCYLGGDGVDPALYGSILSIRFESPVTFHKIISDFNIEFSELKPKANIIFKSILSKDVLDMPLNLFKQFDWE
jgi:hypothetical protein